MLLASQVQKWSYDDTFKLQAVEDAEEITKRATARKFTKVDLDIHAYGKTTMKVFVAALV